MGNITQLGFVIIIVCTIVAGNIFPSLIASNDHLNNKKFEDQKKVDSTRITSSPYTAQLRVYIVEPISRWNNYYGDPYHFGFLGFACNENISIESLHTLQKSITYHGDINPNNIMVITVLFNSKQYQKYADPPFRKPFWAYYVDASAAATPGTTGYNTESTSFTHNVFIEEATATWCTYCPSMGEILFEIYETGNYHFYFVAMIDDKNSEASHRLWDEYNICGFPTAFFDGGYQLCVGGFTGSDVFNTSIETCGIRDVNNLNLSTSVKYVGDGTLEIKVNITNENLPPRIPRTPSGASNGTIKNCYTYTTRSTDPNDDDIWYWFDWGDETNTGWIGPYPSIATISATHQWTKKGTYHIKVKASDSFNAESGWSDPLPVTMPCSYSKQIPYVLTLLFQRFSYAFFNESLRKKT